MGNIAGLLVGPLFDLIGKYFPSEEEKEKAKVAIMQAEAEGKLHEKNFSKAVYEPFTPEQISKKIAEMLKPEEVQAEVDIIYQSIEGLYNACPHNHGDWYFTGNYPTSGGNRVVNKAFMNFMEGKDVRGY